MVDKIFISEQSVAGWLLILSGIIFAAGGMLYAGRAIWKWPAGENPGYLILERGFVIAAVLIVTLGLVLLERLLEAAGDRILSPIGLAIYTIGAVLILVAETYNLSQHEWLYASIVVYVILAFLGQAVFGVALLGAGILPTWVAWVMILWNLAWLVILPIARPRDMYYPWLNYAAPLMIGIALLVRK